MRRGKATNAGVDHSTICLPISKDDYFALLDFPQQFRSWLDQSFRDSPEPFPTAFALGYTSTPPLTRFQGKHSNYPEQG